MDRASLRKGARAPAPASKRPVDEFFNLPSGSTLIKQSSAIDPLSSKQYVLDVHRKASNYLTAQLQSRRPPLQDKVRKLKLHHIRSRREGTDFFDQSGRLEPLRIRYDITCMRLSRPDMPFA